MRDIVIGNGNLSGLYHLSVQPISKYDLLALVNEIYGKGATIVPDETVQIDRSLNSDRFRRATGYLPSAWPELVRAMYRDYCAYGAAFGSTVGTVDH